MKAVKQQIALIFILMKKWANEGRSLLSYRRASPYDRLYSALSGLWDNIILS
jgi:hypothetical protein